MRGFLWQKRILGEMSCNGIPFAVTRERERERVNQFMAYGYDKTSVTNYTTVYLLTDYGIIESCRR